MLLHLRLNLILFFRYLSNKSKSLREFVRLRRRETETLETSVGATEQLTLTHATSNADFKEERKGLITVHCNHDYESEKQHNGSSKSRA